MDSPDKKLNSSALERFVSKAHEEEVKTLKEQLAEKEAKVKETQKAGWLRAPAEIKSDQVHGLVAL